MTTYFIGRHQGAKDWVNQQGLAVDEMLSHLDVSRIKAGDTVIGTLPVNLVAEICARQANYIHLVLELPLALRGKELTVNEMEQAGAYLQAYKAEKVTNG